MVPHGLLHSLITSRILRALDSFVEHSGLDIYVARGAGFTIGSATLRIPDLLVVSGQRVAAAMAVPGGWLRLSPDIAIEVVTPDDPTAGIDSTVQQYVESGTISVWVVHPQKRTVMVYRRSRLRIELTDNMVLTESDLLPGFGIGIREIFPDIRAG